MNAKIYIAIPVHNRLAIAEECIPTVRDGIIHGHDALALYGDGFSLSEKLVGLADEPVEIPHIGIERQRRMHFMHFLGARFRDFTHLYLTDADALHAPTWREELLRIQEKYGGIQICGYNTEAHARILGNTLEDDPGSEVIIRRVAPGISYLLTREHVEQVVAWLVKHPGEFHWQFDWTVPAILGHRFAVTRTSYVDHIGYGGYHHPPSEGYDGGDRATDPCIWLIQKRAEVVAKLKAQDANRS